MVTRAAHPGPAGEYEHLQLTTLAGWRGFVTEMPAVPDLLPEAIWTGLEEGTRACYADDRIDHHSRLLATSGRLVIGVLAGHPLGRQQARPVRRLWFQAKRGPPLVQAGGIAHWPQLQDTIPDLVLGSVDLRLAPVHQYPVHQVCQVGRAGVTPRHRVLEQG